MAPQLFGSFAAALNTMQPQQQQARRDQPLGGLPAAIAAAINSPGAKVIQGALTWLSAACCR